jgi:hypothetical protein
MKCNRCGRDIKEGENYTHFGETLCEDCYLDRRLEVKGCDPWAVHSAKRWRESSGLAGAKGLNDLQKAIYELVKSKGKVTREEVMGNFNISEQEIQKQLAILRHCELVKGYKEDGKVYLVPFHQEGILA